MVGNLHIVEFQLCPANLNVITPPQFPGAGQSSVVLMLLLRICCWVLVAASRQFPDAG